MAAPVIKRIYEPVADNDGTRVLVDRLWPRGVSKTDAHIDLWLKDIAPSPFLRQWFGHDPKRWDGFRRRYLNELRQNHAAVNVMEAQIRAGPVTLIYAARDERHNHARVLAEYFVSKADVHV